VREKREAGAAVAAGGGGGGVVRWELFDHSSQKGGCEGGEPYMTSGNGAYLLKESED